jgi:hypothetical protein
MLIAGRGMEGIELGTAQFAFRDGTPEDSVATVHAALDAGVMLIDMALAYTRPGVESYSEQVIARAVRGMTKGCPLIATKGGHWRMGDSFPVDGRPDTLRTHCEISLRTWKPTGSTCTSCTMSIRRCRCPTVSALSSSYGRKAGSRLSAIQRDRRPVGSGIRCRSDRHGAEPAVLQ